MKRKDDELSVMKRIMDALIALPKPARMRVIRWATDWASEDEAVEVPIQIPEKQDQLF